MFFRLMYHVVLPLYVGFVIIASILLGKSQNDILLITVGVLFTASIFLEKALPRHLVALSVAQAVLLFVFHGVSQVNWCFTLYIILLSKDLFQHIQSVLKASLLGFLFILLYTIVRVLYTPFTAYSLLAVGSDFLTSLAVVLIIQYIIEMERQRNALKEEKKREEMLFENEKMRLVGGLAASLAHEIRNPLFTIQGFLQLSKSRGYNIEPWYDLIQGEVGRMNQLTVEFLQFSKPAPSSYRVLNIQDCLQRVVSLTESKAHSLGHRIVLGAPRHEHAPALHVRMDLDKMVQVFLNIVNNALDALDDGGRGGTVTIAANAAIGGKEALIEVRDTGSGIRKEDLMMIFDPFFTTKADGTGLGLSICKKIIQDHGGAIEVSSIVGDGTSFKIRLPLASSETAQ